MSQFRQKPVRTRKGKGSRGRSFSFFQTSRPASRRKSEASFIGRQEKTRPSGFSFPVPSPMTLAVIAGTVVISLIALNWDGINTKVPDNHTFLPPADKDSERHIKKYAEAGVPAILPTLKFPEKDQSDASETETEVTENEISIDLFETFKWSSYKVQKGDSVSKIAANFGLSMDAIIASNEIRNARRLREGETLRIPNIDGIPYTIKKGDSLSKISKTYNVPFEVILDVNDMRSETVREGEILFIPGARMPSGDLRLAMGDLFIYPVRKSISSYYGWRKDPFTGEQSFHTGIDLRADTGTPVKAAMDGIVLTTGNNWLYGQHILMSHNNGYNTLYAHLSAFSVKQGDRVSQGKKIGEVGSTGRSTGPHLHFGVFNKNGRSVNPLDLLY